MCTKIKCIGILSKKNKSQFTYRISKILNMDTKNKKM